MKNMKEKNNVLYTCVSCIMVLLVLCYFGINTTFKGTYSAVSCADDQTLVDFNGGKACLLKGFQLDTTSGEYSCVTSATGELLADSYTKQGWTCKNDVYNEDGTPVYECTKKITAISDCLTKTVTNNSTTTCESGWVPVFSAADNMERCVPESMEFNVIGTDDKHYVVDIYEFTDGYYCKYSGTEDFDCKTLGLGWSSLGIEYGVNMCRSGVMDCISYKRGISYECDKCFSPSFDNVTGGDDYTIKSSSTCNNNSNYKIVGWKETLKDYTFELGEKIKANETLSLECVLEEKSEKKDITITLESKTATYTGKAIAGNEPKVEPDSGGKVYRTYYTDSTCKTKVPTSTGASEEGKGPVDAGTYYVKATVEANGNYNRADSACVKHVIKQKSIDVSWGSTTSFTYNGKEQGPSATIKTNISGEEMQLNLTNAKEVGSHTSTASCKSVSGGRGKCANYTLTNTEKSFTIKADGTSDSSKTFKVTFNSNGGTIKGSSSGSCTTKTDSCDITTLPTATKDGYTFKGWNTSSSCTSGNTSKITLKKDATYYACWGQTTYTDDESVDNPQTGDIAIALTWFVGMLAIGYSFHYFKTVKENQ